MRCGHDSGAEGSPRWPGRPRQTARRDDGTRRRPSDCSAARSCSRTRDEF